MGRTSVTLAEDRVCRRQGRNFGGGCRLVLPLD